MLKVLLLLLILIMIYCSINNKEDFRLLYPVHGDFCEKRGLAKSYIPQGCNLTNGYSNDKSNCRCVDPSTGLCALCYPPSRKTFVMFADDRNKYRKKY